LELKDFLIKRGFVLSFKYAGLCHTLTLGGWLNHMVTLWLSASHVDAKVPELASCCSSFPAYILFTITYQFCLGHPSPLWNPSICCFGIVYCSIRNVCCSCLDVLPPCKVLSDFICPVLLHTFLLLTFPFMVIYFLLCDAMLTWYILQAHSQNVVKVDRINHGTGSVSGGYRYHNRGNYDVTNSVEWVSPSSANQGSSQGWSSLSMVCCRGL